MHRVARRPSGREISLMASLVAASPKILQLEL